jgi:hypothetical protein
MPTRQRYNPIKLRGLGPTASEIILRDRDHIPGRNQPDKAAQEPQDEQSSGEEEILSRKTSAKSHVKSKNNLTP